MDHKELIDKMDQFAARVLQGGEKFHHWRKINLKGLLGDYELETA